MNFITEISLVGCLPGGRAHFVVAAPCAGNPSYAADNTVINKDYYQRSCRLADLVCMLTWA